MKRQYYTIFEACSSMIVFAINGCTQLTAMMKSMPINDKNLIKEINLKIKQKTIFQLRELI